MQAYDSAARRARRRSIVLTASTSALQGEHKRVSYGVSKIGITQLARHVAAAYGTQRIRCNAICPGLILTPERDLPVPIQDRYLRFMASPRPGRPTDIAEMVAFLASDAAEYVTGQTINVDGGVVAMNAMSMERWG